MDESQKDKAYLEFEKAPQALVDPEVGVVSHRYEVSEDGMGGFVDQELGVLLQEMLFQCLMLEPWRMRLMLLTAAVDRGSFSVSSVGKW